MSKIKKTALSPFAKEVVEGLIKTDKTEDIKNKTRISFASLVEEELTKEERLAYEESVKDKSPLVKSVLNVLNGSGKSIERLAFDSSPHHSNTYHGLYRSKLRLLPDELLKRISIQDSLVAAICNARSNHISSFGRPQPDRFSTGFRIEPRPGLLDNLDEEKKKKLQDRIAEAELLMLTCGKPEGHKEVDRMTLGQFLFSSTRNAIVFGRIATEAISVLNSKTGKMEFHSFRPIDSGTIYRALPQREAAQQLRDQALKMLEQMKNKKLQPERFKNDEYQFVQVIEGRPVQAFTDEECLVSNFYPVTDVELDGYPVTPLDTVISEVTTHINITSHNKLYFQNGRAARGMVVIRSDDIDTSQIDSIRQHFQASINSAGSSWRTPIFGVGSDDDVSWMTIDGSGRDMEFQYLSDTTARIILSAFQMSPEELSGYQHLSRGSNSQTLSESNSEYKIEAARDTGIRPLLANFQNFINSRILPLIDPDLAKDCSFKFVGLEAETAERESIRLQQDLGLHMTMDEVLEKVQKQPVGREWGGQLILNQGWLAQLDKYVPVGKIMEHFFGIEGAGKDPRFQYIRDPFFFQWFQTQQQIQMQNQQMQQQQAAPASEPSQTPQQEQRHGDGQDAQPQQGQDLTRSIDQVMGLLSKGEQQLPPSKRQLIALQNKVVEQSVKSFEQEAKKTLDDILELADKHIPKKR